MSCFSVTNPFPRTFYYVENEMESYIIGGRGLKNLTYPYMGAGEGSKIVKIILT